MHFTLPVESITTASRDLSLKEKSVPITCRFGRLELGIPSCPAKGKRSSRRCGGELISCWYRFPDGNIESCFQCSKGECRRIFREDYLKKHCNFNVQEVPVRLPSDISKSRNKNSNKDSNRRND